jgi:hypothetical protein
MFRIKHLRPRRCACAHCFPQFVCTGRVALVSGEKRIRVAGQKAHMPGFCAGRFFPLKTRDLSLGMTLPHNFVHRKCAERLLRGLLRRCAARPMRVDGTARKRGRVFNLYRIKDLTWHKAACTHSFPQNVCKTKRTALCGFPSAAQGARPPVHCG